MFTASVETAPATESQVNTESHDVSVRQADASVALSAVISPADPQFTISLRNLIQDELHRVMDCHSRSSNREYLGSSPALSEDSCHSRRSSQSSRSCRWSHSCRSPDRRSDRSCHSSRSRSTLSRDTRSPPSLHKLEPFGSSSRSRAPPLATFSHPLPSPVAGCHRLVRRSCSSRPPDRQLLS